MEHNICDFSEILAWAKENEKKYPALAELREENIGVTTILRLDVPLGKKIGLVLTFDKAVANAFRKKDYAAGIVIDIKAARKYVEEWANWAKKQGKKTG